MQTRIDQARLRLYVDLHGRRGQRRTPAPPGSCQAHQAHALDGTRPRPGWPWSRGSGSVPGAPGGPAHRTARSRTHSRADRPLLACCPPGSRWATTRLSSTRSSSVRCPNVLKQGVAAAATPEAREEVAEIVEQVAKVAPEVAAPAQSSIDYSRLILEMVRSILNEDPAFWELEKEILRESKPSFRTPLPCCCSTLRSSTSRPLWRVTAASLCCSSLRYL